MYMYILITILLIIGMFNVTTKDFSFGLSLICNAIVLFILWTRVFQRRGK